MVSLLLLAVAGLAVLAAILVAGGIAGNRLPLADPPGFVTRISTYLGSNVARTDAAVLGREEPAAEASRHVHDQRARAQEAAAQLVDGHRVDLVAPGVALGADDVVVAGPRMEDRTVAEAPAARSCLTQPTAPDAAARCSAVRAS